MPETHIDEELLNRYHDGDLQADAATEVTAHLERCGGCAERLGALEALHGHLAEHVAQSAQGVDFEALFQRIERGIEREQRPQPVPLASRRKARVARVWAASAGVLAAAAAAFLIVRGGGLQPQDGANANASIEIEEVAFNDDYGGTVFEVALAEGVSTRVVWINDFDYDDEGGGEAEEAVQ